MWFREAEKQRDPRQIETFWSQTSGQDRKVPEEIWHLGKAGRLTWSLCVCAIKRQASGSALRRMAHPPKLVDAKKSLLCSKRGHIMLTRCTHVHPLGNQSVAACTENRVKLVFDIHQNLSLWQHAENKLYTTNRHHCSPSIRNHLQRAAVQTASRKWTNVIMGEERSWEAQVR